MYNMSRRPGIEFQNFIASIERTVAAQGNAVVESPKRVRDLVTRRWREHDVVITHRVGHHRLVTAIECRDKRRKVGVPEIEQFDAKCKSTGINRGLIASSAGFTVTAIEKANIVGIGCITVNPAESFDFINGLNHVIEKYRDFYFLNFDLLFGDHKTTSDVTYGDLVTPWDEKTRMKVMNDWVVTIPAEDEIEGNR
jgi:Restriction endonuclease